jgi:hypothetical protein
LAILIIIVILGFVFKDDIINLLFIKTRTNAVAENIYNYKIFSSSTTFSYYPDKKNNNVFLSTYEAKFNPIIDSLNLNNQVNGKTIVSLTLYSKQKVDTNINIDNNIIDAALLLLKANNEIRANFFIKNNIALIKVPNFDYKTKMVTSNDIHGLSKIYFQDSIKSLITYLNNNELPKPNNTIDELQTYIKQNSKRKK